MQIISNGSKWMGEKPDSLETLLELLGQEPLDPSFEAYGNFFYALGGPDGHDDGRPGFHAFGNFFHVSHVFGIDGTHEELAELERAIRANQASPAYAAARVKREAGIEAARRAAEERRRRDEAEAAWRAASFSEVRP